MPRSKLGLKLPVEKLLQKEGCNPVALLAAMVMEKDANGEWVLTGRDRLMAIFKLTEFQASKKKPVETIAEEDRNIEIVRQTFTMPDPAKTTKIIEVKPSDEDKPQKASSDS